MASTPTRIPGVVDGGVSAALDAEGNISFHISIGDTDGRGDYVELIVSRDHAAELGELLLAGAHSAAPVPRATLPVPCSVGIRLVPAAETR